MAAAVADQMAAHREAVRSVLLRLVKDQALAEDLLQEALLRATRSCDGHRGEASANTWLTAVALNVARDHFRRTKRLPPTVPLDQIEDLPSGDRPDHDVLEAEMSRCILGLIARLSERQRETVLLHHFAGLDHREIAGALGISEGNARVTLHRGLAAMRDSLRTECILDFGDDIPCERR